MRKICQVLLLVGAFLGLASCADSERDSEPAARADSRAGTDAPVARTDEPRGEAAREGSTTEIVDASFAEIDTNDDGFLSREETREVEALRNIFALADRDQDGRLNVPEYSHATLEGTRVSADAARGPLFLSLDEDENGRITPEEAQGVPQLQQSFGAFDADGSGSLDEQEYADALDAGLTPAESASDSGGATDRDDASPTPD